MHSWDDLSPEQQKAMYDVERARVTGLMDTVPNILMEVDQNAVFLRANPAGMAFFGDDVIGHPCTDFLAGEIGDAHILLSHIFDGSETDIDFQVKMRRRDGEVRLLKWHSHVLRDPNGTIISALCNAYDITEADQTRGALAQSEALKTALVENALDGIITINSQGIIISYNKAAERLFLYPEKEVKGRNVSMLMPDPHHSAHDDYIKAYLESGQARIIGKGREVNGLRKDGSQFPFRLTVSRPVVMDEQTYFIGFVRDLTYEKNVEAQLRQAQKMESMGTLAGGIAHDFNNILGGVIAYAELILEDVEAGSYLYDDISEMLNGCNRARDLVQQILTFSRQDKPKREPLYLYPIIKESLKLMRATIPSTIEIRRDVDTNTGAVVADVTQIHQVMMNLCANAHYAMRENGGILGVKLSEVDIDEHNGGKVDLPFGRYVLLSISDTGVGMDTATRGRIFEPFFTTKGVGEGTGMGLSVVHGIIKNHGGDVTVASTLGEGTTFDVYFPMYQEKAATAEESAVEANEGNGHVLLVDDDQFLLKAQRRILERNGYRVSTYADPELALLGFNKEPHVFDLAITDQTMPRLTGLELCRALLSKRPDLPVILTTGFSDAVNPQTLKQAGVREFLMKPVPKDQLLQTIKALLEHA